MLLEERGEKQGETQSLHSTGTIPQSKDVSALSWYDLIQEAVLDRSRSDASSATQMELIPLINYTLYHVRGSEGQKCPAYRTAVRLF